MKLSHPLNNIPAQVTKSATNPAFSATPSQPTMQQTANGTTSLLSGTYPKPLLGKIQFGSKTRQIQEDFGEIIRTGSTKKLKEFIQRNNPNIIPLGGRTTDPDTGKVINNNLPLFKFLIRLGDFELINAAYEIESNIPLDIDWPDEDNHSTPLNLCVREGNLEGVEWLLNRGASPDGKDRDGLLDIYGNTPLHVVMSVDIASSAQDRAKFTNKIYKQVDKTEVHVPSDAEAKALAEQAMKNIPPMLLQAGADPNIKNNSGDYPLTLALEYKAWDAAKLMLTNPYHAKNQADPNVKNKDGVSALMLAYNAKQPNLVKLLLDRGADLDFVNPDGETLLSRAIDDKNLEIINYAIDKGADVDTVSNSVPIVQQAFIDGSPETSSLLLRKGANPKQTNGYGMNLLHVFLSNIGVDKAMSPQENSLFKQILEKMPFEVNTPDDDGVTPLMLAAQAKNLVAVETLLDMDADVNAITKQGASIIDFLINDNEGDKKDMRDLLKGLVDPDNDTKKNIKLSETEKQILKLLRKTEEFNVQNKNDSAVLKLTDEEDVPRLRALFRATKLNPALAKFNINARSASGLTPLMIAVKKENLELIDLLIEYDADATLEAKDANGLNALKLAKSAKNQAVLHKIEQYLKESGQSESDASEEVA